MSTYRLVENRVGRDKENPTLRKKRTGFQKIIMTLKGEEKIVKVGGRKIAV